MASVPATAPALRHRLAAWIGNAPPPPASPAALRVVADKPGRDSIRRKLYDEVGDFLFAHGLVPTADNFRVVHAYISGDDRAIVDAITNELRHTDRITQTTIDRIDRATRQAALEPEMMAVLAGLLEARLVDCLAAVDRSATSAESYGSALDAESRNLARDPAATLDRVIALTREAVEATRLAEGQLKQTRREADRLRTDLDRARRAAERDHLTGLPNRRCFEARANAIVAAKDATACIALCDIDDFKQVNDRYGHHAGDRVLTFVARFLKAELGSKVLVTRYGGEEFACLFARTDAPAALAALDAVRNRLANRSLVNQDDGQPMASITFSAGITPIGDDLAAALRAADLALYSAKRTGKNRVLIAPAADPATAAA